MNIITLKGTAAFWAFSLTGKAQGTSISLHSAINE